MQKDRDRHIRKAVHNISDLFSVVQPMTAPSRLAVLTLPQASPALGAFYRGMRVATAGLLGLCRPARPPLTLRLRRKVCTPPN